MVHHRDKSLSTGDSSQYHANRKLGEAPYAIWLLFIATKEIMQTHRQLLLFWSVTESCRFSVVRVMFSIPKRVTSLCFNFLALSEMFTLFEALMYHITRVVCFPLIRVIICLLKL